MPAVQDRGTYLSKKSVLMISIVLGGSSTSGFPSIFMSFVRRNITLAKT